MKFFILFVAAYAGAAKHKASGQIVHVLHNVGFEFKIWNKKKSTRTNKNQAQMPRLKLKTHVWKGVLFPFKCFILLQNSQNEDVKLCG